MSNRTPLQRWLAGILGAACLTLAFAGLAGLLPMVVESPLVLRLANAAAFSGVGWMTLRLRQRGHVLEPALGAASAVLVVGALQALLLPALRERMGWERLGSSVLSSAACAFSLAWLGALLACGGRDRGRAPRNARVGARQRSLTRRERHPPLPGLAPDGSAST